MTKEIDIVDAFKFLWSAKISIIIGSMSFCIIGVGLSFLFTPKYTIKAIVSIEEIDSSQQGALSGLAGAASLIGLGGGGGNGIRPKAIELLKSDRTLDKLITDNQLLPVLFSGKWDSKIKAWKVEDKEIPTKWDGVKTLRNNIVKVSEDRTTKLVSVSIVWRDKQIADHWLKAIIKISDDFLREEAANDSAATVRLLENELQKTKINDVRLSISTLLERYLEKNIITQSKTEYTYKYVDYSLLPPDDEYTSPNHKVFGFAFFLIGGLAALMFSIVRKNRPL